MQKLLTILLTTCLTMATHAAANGIDGELLVKVGTTGNKAIPTSQTTNVTISATSKVTDGPSAVAFNFGSSNALTTDIFQSIAGPLLMELDNSSTGMIRFQANGAIMVGPSFPTFWNGPLSGGSIAAFQDARNGDEDSIFLSAEAQSATDVYAYGEWLGSSTEVKNRTHAFSGANAANWGVDIAANGTSLSEVANHGDTNGVVHLLWVFDPALRWGSVPYSFDNGQTLSSNNFIEFKNNGTNIATLSYNGSLTVHGIVGVTDASDAPAGSVGEYVSSIIPTASAVALVDATAKNITSISLTAGDWDVEGLVTFITTGTTPGVGHYLYAVANTTSATISANGDETLIAPYSLVTAAGSVTLTLTRKRINVSTTTTVYLVGFADFNTGTWTANGAITARRMR